MCHPILVLALLQDFDVTNARVGAERNPLKTEVICGVNDLDVALPECEIGDGRLAKTSAPTAGSSTLGVAVGHFITDQLRTKADVIRAVRESLGVSRINHILRVQGHKILEEQRAAAIYERSGSDHSNGSSRVSREDSTTQATLSAGQFEIGFKRARDIAAPVHLEALQPNRASRVRSETQFGRAFSLTRSWRGVSLRSSRPPPPPISAHSTTTEQATAKLCIQKAAQAAGEPWQQTVSGQQGPGVTNPTIASLGHPSSASQEEDSSDMGFSAPRKSRPSGPQFNAQHSPREALPPGRVRGKCPDAARLHYQRPEKTRQQSLGGRWPVPFLCLLSGSTAGTRRNLQHRRSHAGALRVCSCRSLRHNTGRPWHHHATQEAQQLRNPGRLIYLLHCCPRTQCGAGRVRGASPQRQPAEMLHKRHSIVN